jgi:hypothetical protein
LLKGQTKKHNFLFEIIGLGSWDGNRLSFLGQFSIKFQKSEKARMNKVLCLQNMFGRNSLLVRLKRKRGISHCGGDRNFFMGYYAPSSFVG